MSYFAKLFRICLAVLCLLQLRVIYAASIPANVFEPVHADLTMGKADDAISLLGSLLAANPQDPEAHNLLCRVYYQEERWDDAIHECEIAVQLKPMDGSYHLWLGRAYGEKADSIHSIKAYGLAKKVRDEFERAVQLDSENVDALSDLGEFYTAAPGIVGGGKKKGQNVAQTLERYAPAQAHQLKGRLAEKDKNYTLAESEFKQAVEASNQSADAWMALGVFLLTTPSNRTDVGRAACGDRCGCKSSQAARARAGGRCWASDAQQPGPATRHPTIAAISRFAEQISRFSRLPGVCEAGPFVGATG